MNCNKTLQILISKMFGLIVWYEDKKNRRYLNVCSFCNHLQIDLSFNSWKQLFTQMSIPNKSSNLNIFYTCGWMQISTFNLWILNQWHNWVCVCFFSHLILIVIKIELLLSLCVFFFLTKWHIVYYWPKSDFGWIRCDICLSARAIFSWSLRTATIQAKLFCVNYCTGIDYLIVKQNLVIFREETRGDITTNDAKISEK